MVYQEILHEVRPDVIVEAGTASGGSALFLATVCDALGAGRIVTIDIDPATARPAHPRIEYLYGPSVSEIILRQVRGRIAPADRVLVILDSDHRRDYVYRELAA